jgi:hypothetical protein
MNGIPSDTSLSKASMPPSTTVAKSNIVVFPAAQFLPNHSSQNTFSTMFIYANKVKLNQTHSGGLFCFWDLGTVS